MASLSERGIELKREEILAKAPFTRMYLSNWGEEDLPVLAQKQAVIIAEITEKSAMSFRILMGILFFSTNSCHVYHPKLPFEAKQSAVLAVMSIGYEIGNGEDCRLFVEDIFNKLGRDEIFRVSSQEEEISFQAQFVANLLCVGLFFKRAFSSGDNSGEEGPFRQFIDGLSF